MSKTINWNQRCDVDGERALRFRTSGSQGCDEGQDVGQDDEQEILQSQRTILATKIQKTLVQKCYSY